MLYLAVPFVVLRLLFKSLAAPAYRERLHERFGYVAVSDKTRPLLWIHAVSVGEVHAARPLIDKIIITYPGYRIVVSTMTPTGAETVKRFFGNSIMHVYVPYDLPDAVRRCISRLRPALLIVMETEIWPNLFYSCRRYGIPVIIANGRLSEKSFDGYRRVERLTAMALSDVTQIIAQTQADADRFMRLGIDQSRIYVSGNLKFDIELSNELEDADPKFSRGQIRQRPVWIAASTHSGEEEIIIAVHRQLLHEHGNCLLIIAPRHPDRAADVAELSRRSGLTTIIKSQVQGIDENARVFIIDTLGELPMFYSISDLAFVGGSLVPVGGHNMLEPASLGVPVITGPYVHNFTEITAQLIESGAAWMVQDEGQLIQLTKLLLNDSILRQNASAKARDLIIRNRGTSERVMQALKPLLYVHATSATERI